MEQQTTKQAESGGTSPGPRALIAEVVKTMSLDTEDIEFYTEEVADLITEAGIKLDTVGASYMISHEAEAAELIETMRRLTIDGYGLEAYGAFVNYQEEIISYDSFQGAYRGEVVIQRRICRGDRIQHWRFARQSS